MNLGHITKESKNIENFFEENLGDEQNNFKDLQINLKNYFSKIIILKEENDQDCENEEYSGFLKRLGLEDEVEQTDKFFEEWGHDEILNEFNL